MMEFFHWLVEDAWNWAAVAVLVLLFRPFSIELTNVGNSEICNDTYNNGEQNGSSKQE